MTLPLAIVDAFTSEAFSGNQAAVCVMLGPRDASWMQKVASEMNFAETAFLNPHGHGEFELRWFSPAVEIDLCGHATLASAHVLWETGRLARDTEARFHTRSGLLTANQRGDWIELDFPATPAEPVAAPLGLLEALGTTAAYVGKSKFDYLVELDSEAAVRNLEPDFARLGAIPARGVMLTVDFVSRFFGPAVGIDEDPATGSAHCCLAPFWSERLAKTAFSAHQLSKRGAVLEVELKGDRVLLRGHAVTVLRGELLV